MLASVSFIFGSVGGLREKIRHFGDPTKMFGNIDMLGSVIRDLFSDSVRACMYVREPLQGCRGGMTF